VAAVRTSGLTKTFGNIEAVRGVDLEVHSGETFGFLGPNGAGKSTTINILCTLATPTAGTAEVAGYDVVRCRDDVRRNIGLPLTYAVEPMRAAVFDHLALDPATRRAFAPGITWFGWHVPVFVQVLLVIAMAILMLAVAVRRFSKTE